jgi:SPX domain protein involved in polyphosphate accumulation
MKFGATFSRRSVPQWRAHDLDYDDIKNLIKAKTSSDEGCTRGFEANLLAILDSELERVPNPPLHALT